MGANSTLNTKINFEQWYFPKDQEIRDALHWEILKEMRSRELVFRDRSNDANERFINIGKIGAFKEKLSQKYKDVENPEWDMYASVEHLSKTSQTTRSQFKKQLDQGKSHEEIARQHGTFEKSVEKHHELLKQNKLDKEIYFPSNLKQHWDQHLYDNPPFDIVFDIDGDIKNTEDREKGIMQAYKEAQKITRFFDRHNTPYSVRFSGGKGFHIVIPRDKLARYIDHNSFKKYAGTFAKFIKEKTGAEFDPAIYTEKRILRLPYTLHGETGLVCLPLNDQQFRNFNIEMAKPSNVRENISIKYRGNCIRTGKANKIIKAFREWKEENNIEIPKKQQEDTDERDEEVQELASKISQLTKEQRQKLEEEVLN